MLGCVDGLDWGTFPAYFHGATFETAFWLKVEVEAEAHSQQAEPTPQLFNLMYRETHHVADNHGLNSCQPQGW